VGLAVMGCHTQSLEHRYIMRVAVVEVRFVHLIAPVVVEAVDIGWVAQQIQHIRVRTVLAAEAEEQLNLEQQPEQLVALDALSLDSLC
jgi:hypothetical protein